MTTKRKAVIIFDNAYTICSYIMVIFTCILLTAVIIVAEIIIKKHILRLPDEYFSSVGLSTGFVRLHRRRNYGLMLNILQKHSRLMPALTALVILAFILLTAPLLLQSSPPGLVIALGLLYGGALSNLLDRLRWGYVLDYISFPCIQPKRLRRIIFNLADLCIFAGVLLLFICYLLL